MEIDCVFFFNDSATAEIYTRSLHDALPISSAERGLKGNRLISVSGEDKYFSSGV